MYPKIKKYKQQDFFDNFLTMPSKRKGMFYVVSVLKLANWGRIYGVKNVSLRTRDNCKTFKVFVEFGNGRKWHTRSIINRGKEDTAYALYSYLLTISEFDLHLSFDGYDYDSLVRKKYRRLKKLLKKSDIH